jgi:hypothetical protein
LARPLWAALRQPRILLILLAAWSALGAVTEFFSNSGLFLELHGGEADGALGGLALNWEAIPLAALYLYAARDPARFQRVFWLALVHTAAGVVANIYHWGAGDFSIESVLLPIILSGSLGVLVFLHLFQPKEERERQAG